MATSFHVGVSPDAPLKVRNAISIGCQGVCEDLTCAAYSEEACEFAQMLGCPCKGCDCPKRRLDDAMSISVSAPDEASLRAAVNSVNGSVAGTDSVTADVGSSNTIELRAELFIENVARFLGVDSYLVAVGSHRIVTVNADATLELEGLTLKGGTALVSASPSDLKNRGGCVLVLGGTLRTLQTTFVGCCAVSGGAIAAYHGTVILDHLSRITQCTSIYSGGG
jgi:hypothetical protein